MTHFSQARLNYIRPDHLSETQDRITFEETDAAGRATITFVAQKPCLRVKPAKRHPVSWSRHQKCADGAIIEFKDQKSVLHGVELKKHINTGNWGDAKKQFAGMLVNALALGGALGVVGGILFGNLLSFVVKAPPVIPWDWVGIGLAICSAVGILFGTYPAWKAAHLDPIDSLRYE